jgi:hypothetical protein
MFPVLTALVLAGIALAAPTLVNRDTTVSVLSAATIATYAPYTRFASAAYCSTASTWTCGEFSSLYAWHLLQPKAVLAQCKNLPGFVPYATGGDGDAIPKCMPSFC